MKGRFQFRHKFQVSEAGRFLAAQSLERPREFNTFPSVWGRQVIWVKPGKGELAFVRITPSVAKAAFERGDIVFYIAHGFPYAIKYSEYGMEPTA